MSDGEKCVFCGVDIPEGRQVCPACERDLARGKNFRFVVVVCCQGQPFYHYRRTLVGALYEYAYQYLTKRKYHTMNFSLKQEFFSF